MPRKPEPPKPTSWDIYKVATKAVRLGTVEAPDKSSAIEKAAQEFKAEAWRLYARETTGPTNATYPAHDPDRSSPLVPFRMSTY